jgi:hypothetical protein
MYSQLMIVALLSSSLADADQYDCTVCLVDVDFIMIVIKDL